MQERFKQIYNLSRTIERNQREIDRLKEASLAVGAVDLSVERVMGGKKVDTLATNAMRIADLEALQKERLEELGWLKKWLRRNLDRMPDGLHRDILTKRHLHLESWADIMEGIAYSRRQTFRLYSEARKQFEALTCKYKT